MIAESQRQGRLIEADEVRRALLNGPDLLDAGLAADAYVVITSTPAEATRFRAHPKFLNLLEQPRELFMSRSMHDVASDVSP